MMAFVAPWPTDEPHRRRRIVVALVLVALGALAALFIDPPRLSTVGDDLEPHAPAAPYCLNPPRTP